MPARLRDLPVPAAQRRTLEELTGTLDLRAGDRTSTYSAFWTMLVLSSLITAAGVMSDSTATVIGAMVIGAMVIAPQSTPIMGLGPRRPARRPRHRPGRSRRPRPIDTTQGRTIDVGRVHA